MTTKTNQQTGELGAQSSCSHWWARLASQAQIYNPLPVNARNKDLTIKDMQRYGGKVGIEWEYHGIFALHVDISINPFPLWNNPQKP